MAKHIVLSMEDNGQNLKNATIRSMAKSISRCTQVETVTLDLFLSKPALMLFFVKLLDKAKNVKVVDIHVDQFLSTSQWFRVHDVDKEARVALLKKLFFVSEKVRIYVKESRLQKLQSCDLYEPFKERVCVYVD